MMVTLESSYSQIRFTVPSTDALARRPSRVTIAPALIEDFALSPRGERALDQTERRLARDDRSAPAIRLDETALLERAVGRGDGGGADLELLRQLADRRQPVSGREPLVRDRVLDRLRDRGGAGSAFDLLY